MKKICFFDLLLTRHDTNALPENEYHRIIAGGNVFYTLSSQYENPDVLNQLQVGDRLYIGAHPLADGSYWLHWLASPEHGELKPVITGTNNLKNITKLVFGLMLIIFSVYFLFMQSPHIAAGVALIFVCSAGCLMLESAVQSLLVINNRAAKRFENGVAQIKAGNTEIYCQTQYLLPDTSAEITPKLHEFSDERNNELDSIRPEDYRYAENLALTHVNGTVSELVSVRGVICISRYSRDYIEYQFVCSNAQYTLRNYYSPFIEDLNPFFFHNHSFFIADGDPLKLILNKNSGTIIGIYNERDNNAYIKLSATAVSLQQIKTTYKVITGGALVILLMGFSIVIHDLLKINGTLDKWDWLYAAGSMGGVMLMTTIVFSALLLMTEIIVLLMRKYLVGAARVAFTRQLLVQLRLRNGKNSAVLEIN